MKVLLSAYACEAGRGSEPGVGWNTAWEVAKHHEVWVLTRPDDGKPSNDAFLKEHPNPNLHLVYFTLPIFGGFWQLGSVAFVLHYYLWQIQAYFVARRLHSEIGFDVAHHVTFVRYSSPSFIARLPVPFIWGTIGGAEAALCRAAANSCSNTTSSICNQKRALPVVVVVDDTTSSSVASVVAHWNRSAS